MSHYDAIFDEALQSAKRLGYDDRQRLLDRLHRALVDKQNYLEDRKARGRTGAYNGVVAEEMAAIAAVIELLERTP